MNILFSLPTVCYKQSVHPFLSDGLCWNCKRCQEKSKKESLKHSFSKNLHPRTDEMKFLVLGRKSNI